MNTKSSLDKIERRVSLGNDWCQLWDRYRYLYRDDGAPLSKRYLRYTPPLTVQDYMFERRDWFSDILSGGKEMRLTKRVMTYPKDFHMELEGVTLAQTRVLRDLSDKMTLYYSTALRPISEASKHGYRPAAYDPAYRKNLEKYVGRVSYKRLNLVVRRCEQKKQLLLENDELGPTEFFVFREAGVLGDDMYEIDSEKICRLHQELINKNE